MSMVAGSSAVTGPLAQDPEPSQTGACGPGRCGQGDQPLAVYVDVDETMLRSYGNRQIPIPSVIRQIKALHKQGAALYCWSCQGAEYARECAERCGVAHCFSAFLPKPQLLVDDQQPRQWRRFLHVHPSQCSSQTTVEEYREELRKPRSV